MTREEFEQLPKDQQKAYYKAIMVSEDVWNWLCDNPLKDKMDYAKYKFPTNWSCLLCIYINKYECGSCSKCILANGACCSWYGSDSKSSFDLWIANKEKDNPNWEISFKNATKIWKILFEEKLRIM